MNQFHLVTMIARTTPGTHNPRISAQTVTHRLREIGEIPQYTMYVLYAAFPFWPSTYATTKCHAFLERTICRLLYGTKHKETPTIFLELQTLI